MFDWQWDFAIKILPDLLYGLVNTLAAAFLGYVFAVILGLVFTSARYIPYSALNLAIKEILEFIRATPLVLQIFFLFYAGPQFGLNLEPWTAGLVAIGIHYGTYLSEVYRGALNSVPKAQWEAALSLNFTQLHTCRQIILPQALPAAVSGMGNYMITLLKDTPMLSVIGVAELMLAANVAGANHYRFLEPYTLAGLLFLSVSLICAGLVRILEHWAYRQSGLKA